MNALPKVVLSRTLERADVEQHPHRAGHVGETIAELKREPGKPIVAWAGAGLVSTLAQLRAGRRVPADRPPGRCSAAARRCFRASSSRQKLRLVRTTQLGRGLAVLCYEPVWP